MSGKTHLGIGIITLAALCNKIPVKFNYSGIIIVSIASMLPDIDHPKSLINKYSLLNKTKHIKKFIYFILGLIIIYINFTYIHKQVLYIAPLLLFTVAFSNHRQGITHSLCGLIIAASVSSYLGLKYNVSNLIYYVIIGYGMHIICDMCTKMGVPLLYPFKNKKYKFFLNFSSNSKWGKAIEEFILLIGLMYVIYRLPVILV